MPFDPISYILAKTPRLSRLVVDSDKDWGGHIITNLGEPVNPNDAARKIYVDMAATGLGINYFLLDAADTEVPAYKSMSLDVPELTEAYVETAQNSSGDYEIASWIAPSDGIPLKLGVYELHCQAEVVSGNIPVRLFFRLYERQSGGTEVLIAESMVSDRIDSRRDVIIALILASDHIMTSGSRLVVKLFARYESGGSSTTVRVYYQGDVRSRLAAPISKEILDTVYATKLHAAQHGLGGEDELSLDASQIVSGAFDVARIPDLTRSKITDFFSSPFWDNIPDKPSPFPSDEELALCLPFNEGYGSMVYDVSGNGNHGTIYGATWTRGRLGWALSFDGESNYVEVPDSESLHFNGSDSFTITGWFKLDQLPSERGTRMEVITKHHDFLVSVREIDDKLHFSVYDGTDWTPKVTSNTVLQTGRWYFFTTVYDAGTLKIYLDGELENTQAQTKAEATTNPVVIGYWQFGGFFDGIIDEIRLYARALTEEEIKALYYSSQSIRREHVTSVMGVLDSDILPTIDNAYDIGSSSLRWKNGYFAGTVHSADIAFENDWRITEHDEDGNMIEGLRILNNKGEEIFKITEDGLWFKGNKIV